MTDIQAVYKRISRRDFLDKPIAPPLQNDIRAMVDKICMHSGLRISTIFSDEDVNIDFIEPALYGRFQNAKNFIVLWVDNQIAFLNEKIGFYGQGLVLDLIKMGLDSCWVGITPPRKTTSIDDKTPLRIVIAFGYADENLSVFEMGAVASTRYISRPVESMFTAKEAVPHAFIEGIRAVQVAPSTMNRLPVMFRYEDKKAFVAVEKPNSLQGIDLGIAIRHFIIGSDKQIPVRFLNRKIDRNDVLYQDLTFSSCLV